MSNSWANSDADFRAQKDALRAQIAAARARMTPLERSLASGLLQEQLLRALQERYAAEPTGGRVLASYLARPDEPDCGASLLVSEGFRVLVPVLSGAPVVAGRRVPCWSWLRLGDAMAPGLHGIPEAVGADRAGVDSVANFGGPETLPASAVAAAQVVIVPGLAGGRDGSRLGTGGGWYDEALGFRDPAAEVWLLLFDGEVFDSVPSEPHDVPVTRIFTPSGRIVIEM